VVGAAGLSVDTTDRADVVAFFNANYRPGNAVAMGWTGSYATCTAGTTAPAYADATLQRVNYFRAMAGLPGTVVLDATLNAKDQSAALMMSAQGALSHTPPTTFACYSTAGAQAAGSSNLALFAAGPDAITLYMDDAGNSNAGHRRWILFPPQVTMGTGSAPSMSGKISSNALWVLGPFGSRPSGPDGVAWPPRGFVPFQVMPSTSNLWSLTYPGADFSAASVTMARGSVSIPVVVQPLSFGFGDNTLVWKEDGVASLPRKDTTYSVLVNNVKIGAAVRAFAYEVTVIDPDAPAATIFSSVLPASRSVVVGSPATIFATIVNAGAAMVTDCRIALATNVPAALSYQTTNPITNALIGQPNTPVSIAAGAAQSFLVALTPTSAIPPTDVRLIFHCNGGTAPVSVGLNTILLSASPAPTPDLIALAATLNNDGIVVVPSLTMAPATAQTGVFAVATVNVGAGAMITASADTGAASLPLSISICETIPATGICQGAAGPSVTTPIDANATPTFGIFVSASGVVPFDPANHRVFVRFKDAGGATRGATSVAVRTQ
jgi:hypothetical protein